MTKAQRVRLCTRLSFDIRAQLRKYSARSGISESTIVEDALSKYLHGADDTTLVMRRFDQLAEATARNRRDTELLSEAFGRYMRLWFGAHAPAGADTAKGAARSAEGPYRHFAKELAAEFNRGHRFINDVPVEAVGDEEAIE